MSEPVRVEVVLTAETMETIICEVTRRVRAELHADRPHGLMSIPAAAEVLGMTEQALRKHVQRGNVRSVLVGSRRLVVLGSVD